MYPAAPILEVEESTFDFVIDVNLKGLFFLTQEVVKTAMLPNGYGRIVNISSCDGKNPGRGVAIYGAAKAGVISLTKSFASELSLIYFLSILFKCSTSKSKFTVSKFPL